MNCSQSQEPRQWSPESERHNDLHDLDAAILRMMEEDDTPVPKTTPKTPRHSHHRQVGIIFDFRTAQCRGSLDDARAFWNTGVYGIG